MSHRQEGGEAISNVAIRGDDHVREHDRIDRARGAVPVGAFDDTQVRRILALADGEAPLYLIPVGHPR